ncbi:MAG TPA: ABC transporter ATP-binding protein [Planctomycetes bacterium]|nr:ABC transporter ATP-binding protein [Planctomycetota bacterium]
MKDEHEDEGQVRPPALWVQGLGKEYEGGMRALDDLSFQVRPGEILGLVGPNGAGKTTALRMISGVLPIREGRVVLAGHDLATDEVAAKRRLGWVPEDPKPFDTMTVEEHLAFTAALFRVDPWRKRADELLERFELRDKRKALGGELSRGMRQKLAFACAWLPRPAVVLLDEPLSGLDPRGIRAARAAMEELAAEGAALILSSHLLELIQALATRLLILDHGRKVFEGSLEEARTALAPDEGSSLEEIFFAATGEDADGPWLRGGDEER